VPDVPEVEVVVLEGLRPYGEVLEMQRARQRAVIAGEAPNALYIVEHTPTITLGRNTDPKHLLFDEAAYRSQGIEVVPVERGGDVTYHGPGQFVAYPILDLNQWRPSVGWYLRALEETLIRVLGAYGLRGERVEGLTGVWVDGGKVAAIGVALHHWVTIHGIALNVSPETAHFQLIVPCGIADRPVNTLAQLLPQVPPWTDLQGHFLEAFQESFSSKLLVHDRE